MSVKFDLHTHHYRCGHAAGEIQDYIQAAIELGLDAIGISDHSPFFASSEDHAVPAIAMAKSEFGRYVAEVLELKRKYEGKIDVLLGVESDYFPEHETLYRDIYDQYPFDYKIGSVHWVAGRSIFDKNRWKDRSSSELIQEKEEYYSLIAQSARSGMFNILGHIDAMKGYYPPFSDLYTPVVDKTLQIIAEHEVAIEVNTSGITKDCGGWYPTDALLERALHYGVPITFGSDAHIPERVADDLEQVRNKLKVIGFDHWVYFKQGRMVKTGL